MSSRPRAGTGLRIVGIGGTTRPGSSTQRALAAVLAAATDSGAQTVMLGSADLDLPMYAPGERERTPRAERLVRELSRADGVVIASPGYHGGISGLVKNALDYVEDLRQAPRPYLSGRAVGLVACAHGWQASVSTLTALRSVTHALRGWPVPLGVAINSTECSFDADGVPCDHEVAERLRTVGHQVVQFARVSMPVAG